MPGMKETGTVQPRRSADIAYSRIGIGLEKLDRDLYDPAPCYGPIGELGVKWVRIQSGWCRTESIRGVYDFTWLDDIVDRLTAEGTEPWICLCYGNELYTPGGNNKAGSVGRPPIHTEEERVAWDHYVAAVVGRYRGKVRMYEIWNEPDGPWCWRPEPVPGEYGAFALRTARVIRSADPAAKILTGSFCQGLPFLQRYMSRELAEITDYVTYHRYRFDADTGVREYVRGIRAILDSFGGRHIGIIQGETGTQSAYSTRGALRCAGWTERKQAKFLLRKTVADLSTEVLFTSWFSTVDIFENIENDSGERTRDWYGFFGLLGERFDGEGRPLGVYDRKQAYRAMQVLCALFGGHVRPVDLPVQFERRQDPQTGLWDEDAEHAGSAVFTQGFEAENGSRVFAFWKVTDIMTTDYESSVTVTFIGQSADIRLIDPMDGRIYEIAPDRTEISDGTVTLRSIPLRDYPLLVAFGGFGEERG